MECNLVVLAGRLAIDPEEVSLEGGSPLARYLVTVRTDAPRRRVDVIPVTLRDPDATQLVPEMQRGDRVMVIASVQRRFWQSEEGRRSRLEIVAHTVDKRDGDVPVIPTRLHGARDTEHECPVQFRWRC